MQLKCEMQNKTNVDAIVSLLFYYYELLCGLTPIYQKRSTEHFRIVLLNLTQPRL
jgi:hypothetical protein